MTGFDDRREAFENKFAHDEALRFKVIARRNKLLGLWAAEQLGETDSDAYVKAIVLADFEEAGEDDVLRKIKADLDRAGLAISEADLRAKMTELLATAATEIAGR